MENGISKRTMRIISALMAMALLLCSSVISAAAAETDMQTSDFKVETTFVPQKLAPNQMMTAKVSATNISSEPYDGKKDVLMIVGLYDANNTMVNVSYISKGIPYKGSETLSAGFKLPSNIKGYCVRSFMWDGTSLKDTSMIPISNAVELKDESVAVPTPTITPTPSPSITQTENYQWVPYMPSKDQINISLEKDSNGSYHAVVKVAFPSSGYRVSYNSKDVAVAASPELISYIGIAKIEKWTGPALDVITEKTLSYNLGSLSGKYVFRFEEKSVYFEVSPTITPTPLVTPTLTPIPTPSPTGQWIAYSPAKDQIAFSLESDGEQHYQAVFKITFPDTGYRVKYDSQVAMAGIVYPDGSTGMSFVTAYQPVIEKWTGSSSNLETVKTLKYYIGGLSGKSTFRFEDVWFNFEIPQTASPVPTIEPAPSPAPLENIRVDYTPNDKNVSISIITDENGKMKAVVDLTFLTGGYRVDYQSSTSSFPTSSLDTFIGTANISRYTGPVTLALTHARLEYEINRIMSTSSLQFVFNCNGYTKYYKFGTYKE